MTICQVCGQPIYDEENKRLKALLQEIIDNRRIGDFGWTHESDQELVTRIEKELQP